MAGHVDNYIEFINKNNSKGPLTYFLRIFKTFILIAFGFAFLFGIYLSIRINSPYGFVKGLIAGIILASVGLFILIPLDILEKIKCYLKYGVINFEVCQERVFIIDKDYNSVFNILCNILESQRKTSICKKDVENGVIEAETKTSWRSSGEKINVTLSKDSGGKVLVILKSKPKLFITMIDYSKNFENVELIIERIREKVR